MKTQFLIGVIIMCCLFLQNVSAQDKVSVYEPQLPILIERHDNVLFNLRIDAKENKALSEVKLIFREGVKLDEVASVKLYYSGTEGAGRKGIHYSPNLDYIANRLPGNTLVANPSYSILKSEVASPKNQVSFKTDQKLFHHHHSLPRLVELYAHCPSPALSLSKLCSIPCHVSKRPQSRWFPFVYRPI